MSAIAAIPYDQISIACLIVSIVCAWLKSRHFWILPFVAFIATGINSGWIDTTAIYSMIVLAIIVSSYNISLSVLEQPVVFSFIVLASLAFGLKLVPGFEQVEYYTNYPINLRPDFNGIRFSAEKAVLALFLAVRFRDILCGRIREWGRAISTTILPVAMGISVVYALGIFLGVVSVSFMSVGVEEIFLMATLLVRNLFFTVMAEEMLFRPVIQDAISRSIDSSLSKYFALAISSVLFGAVHLAGGWQLGILATVAGTVYGYAYLKSGRVEMAFLAHLILNMGVTILFITKQ